MVDTAYDISSKFLSLVSSELSSEQNVSIKPLIAPHESYKEKAYISATNEASLPAQFTQVDVVRLAVIH
jgi:hypothetical protein